MIPDDLVGRRLNPSTHLVERGRLQHFARACGEDDRIFFDQASARAAGHPDIPAPPTFAFCLEMDRDHPFDYLDTLGVDLSRVLHAGQSFVHHLPIHAGDTITFTSRISDVSHKKGGDITFVTVEREGRKQDGKLATTLHTTLVVRNG